MKEEQWPDAFKECVELFKSTNSSGRLPIYLGTLKDGNFLLSIGKEENPLKLPQEVLFYMYEGLGRLIEKSQKQVFGVDESKLEGKFIKVLEDSYGKKPTVIKSMNPENLDVDFSELLRDGISEDSMKAINDMAANIDPKKKAALEALQAVMGEIKKRQGGEEEPNSELLKSIQDAKKIFDNLSPEEKAELVKEKEQEIAEKQEQSTSELEKELLGDIPETGKLEPEVKDKAYFAKILEKHGRDRLKEELMTLPEEERLEVMKEIYADRKKRLNS